MYTKLETPESAEHLPGKAIAKHKENKLADALNLYAQSIKLNHNQPPWVYSNAITLSAQIDCLDLGNELQAKGSQLYPQSDEIARAIALLYDKQEQEQKAIEFYQRCLVLNPEQPEWVYVKLLNLLIKANLLVQGQKIKQQGLKYFPHSALLQTALIEQEIAPSHHSSSDRFAGSTFSATPVDAISPERATPASIEHYVDLKIGDLAQRRRSLMDSAIVEQYEILLEQVLCHIESGTKEMNPDALIHCLAEIKTDIHYLKTKLLEPTRETVDPQAKGKVDLAKIVNHTQPMPIKCHLGNRIVGSGWHAAEKHGRWTGSGTLSSIVLPYPRQGKYRLEVVVKSEAKSGLLESLTINLNDRPLATTIHQNNGSFPAIVNGEVTIEAQPQQSFLGIDLAIAETVKPQAHDSRLIGLLIESINLIPLQG